MVDRGRQIQIVSGPARTIVFVNAAGTHVFFLIEVSYALLRISATLLEDPQCTVL